MSLNLHLTVTVRFDTDIFFNECPKYCIYYLLRPEITNFPLRRTEFLTLKASSFNYHHLRLDGIYSFEVLINCSI